MTLPMETTPATVTPKITDLCRSLVPNQQPVFVSVSAVDWAEGYPLETAAKQAAQFGGTAILGWSIRQRAGIGLRAEVYAVWKSPSGELIDPSPNSGGESRILFLADPKLNLDAPQPPDRWIALLHRREAEEYLAADQKIREMNRIRQRVDPTAYAQASTELKRAITALEKRLGRSG